MAITVSKAAKGNSGNTAGPVKTPPPIKAFVPGPDVTSRPRSGGDAYGQSSGPANPSSVKPGTAVSSAMAKSLAAGQDDGQHVLDRIIAGKPAGNDGPTGQERSISRDPYPTAFGHRNRNGE